MDEFVDQFFSSSSWPVDKASETSPWIENGPHAQGVYKGDEVNLPASLTLPTHIVDSFITNDPSMFVGVETSFDLQKDVLLGERQPLQEGTYSLQGLLDVNFNTGYMDQNLRAPPTLLSVDTAPAESPSMQPESGSVGSNDSELSEIQPTVTELHPLSSFPQAWPPSSYKDVSSLPPVIVDTQGPNLKGQYLETNADHLQGNSFKDGNVLQGQHELTDHYLSSFATGYKFPLGRSAETHPQYQLSEGKPMKHYIEQSPVSQLPHASATAVGGCNGAVKTRVRARRGQATDPHSIAERLRREKIAERMKNLQVLVPNSSKTDKASMLDEIIDYVKFLQLQVKVLSMSRLGAAGAVVPLITDSQAEGSTGLLMQSAGYGLDPFDSPNDRACEQEIVKLMESNMTTAIQFLQTKGLCLMPIALAAAISGSKASSGSFPPERKKPALTNGLVHHSNAEPHTQKPRVSSNGDIRSMESATSEGISTSGCNGNITKQEELMNTANSSREMNPKEP